ncbi:MAG: hypothetical protein GY717_15115 [Rhodobacteraceae bacterium]|nr:hypothetical protein [Paracoccaceae bacterium]
MPLLNRHAAALALLLLVPATADAQDRLQPDDFTYLGAFRLPNDGERPKTFAWGGNAMTFRPAGGRAPVPSDLPGSLFVMGHDRMAYGALPDGNQVAEITIPRPARAATPQDLPTASFLQPFSDVAAGRFPGLDELPRVGMAYLDAPETGPKIHLAFGQHFQPETPAPSHAWVNPDLSQPGFTGTWHVGDRSGYAGNGYMFEIPAGFAGQHLGGRALATGRFRDGGWSGMGPSLYAYRPWTDAAGTPAKPGARPEQIALLHYATSRETGRIERAMSGYQHPDEWGGGAWIETASGKTAVLFAGTKAVGGKYWYGFANPAGSGQVCVAGEFVGQFAVCRLADGSACPARDLTECSGHNDFRGWWSNEWQAQFILYDPSDFADVAAGRMQPWQPQPYASLSIHRHLMLNPAGIEPETLGTGAQRHYIIGAVAYDRDAGRLFVSELFADDNKPVIHVWQLHSGTRP